MVTMSILVNCYFCQNINQSVLYDRHRNVVRLLTFNVADTVLVARGFRHCMQ